MSMSVQPSVAMIAAPSSASRTACDRPCPRPAPVMNAILAGQIDYDCDPILGPLSHVRAGTVKALAIATKKRSPLLPDVPTSYEQGLPQFDCAPFYALFAPKGTPKAVIDRLADALNKGLNEPAVQKRFADLGAEIAEPGRRGPKSLAYLNTPLYVATWPPYFSLQEVIISKRVTSKSKMATVRLLKKGHLGTIPLWSAMVVRHCPPM